MSGPRSILRPLLHHRWTSLAVLAGAATATAVLTGALVIGDSVRGSLRDLTLERLGGIDQALVGQRFVRENLIDQVADDPAVRDAIAAAAPAILLRGSLEHAERRTRASQVGVQGIDQRFLAVFGHHPASGDDRGSAFFPSQGAKGPFPPVVLNASLAEALGAQAGDAVLLHLKRFTEVPRGSLLGRKETSDVVETLRLVVSRVIDNRGLGRFGLDANQAQPLLAFVPLTDLARALGREGSVNALLIEQTELARAESADLDAALARHLLPGDLGIEVKRQGAVGVVESDELVLRPRVVSSALESIGAAGAQARPVLAYLANTIARQDDSDRSIPYATVAALDTVGGGLVLVNGEPAPSLADGEVLINAWTANDLGAQVGDPLRFDYFTVGPREELIETSTTLTVVGVIAMTGLGGDESLVQEVPGIAGSENMADWDPPFPVELGRVRPVDETYWDDWRDTPKAFVSLATGRRLWATRWGNTTQVRFDLPVGGDLDETIEKVADATVTGVPKDAFGLTFLPVKAAGLAASAGATDFSGLFLGFSIFLIISAALLSALLFRLGIEHRAGEIGLELAIGFPRASIRRRLLAEGTLLAVAGALVGVAGAIAYAGGVMHLLRTRWLPAVGTTALGLEVVPLTLAIGAAASVLVVVLSILRTVRRIARVAPISLMKRVVEPPDAPRPARRLRLIALASLVPAAALLAFAFATGRTAEPGLFFAIGPLLLIGGLAGLALLSERSRGAAQTGAGGTLLRLSASNARRNRGRSLLAAGLVAVATFMIVTVAAFQHDYGSETLDRSSGAGGFTLVATSEVPLLYDPSTEEGRFELGLATSGDPGDLLDRVSILPLRVLPGDDTSCLNLYRPTEPRILGVPPAALARRQAFRFVKTSEPIPEGESPWSLLEKTFDDGAIPVVGDAASMQYILKLKLGGDLIVPGQDGSPVTLRLVGMLATSIFQSEMLIAESQFLRHFPLQEGFGTFLIEVPEEEDAPAISEALEAGLAPYGFDAVPTRDKLAAFHAVQNTYLQTFRTLGGLGLLLGTIGLAVVLLRNVVERRGELGAMRAFGFGRRWLTRLVVVENALLLVAGLALGTIAALVTVLPQLLAEGSHVPWSAIIGTLGTILLVGLAACAAMATGALRTPLLEALKAER